MRKKITLACVDCGSRNYTTAGSKENQTERLELKKFCNNCNAHTVHRETK
ncbi:50S ribosomal protein L33 [Mesobacillus foraminis]|uniref:Large ribosomal subunit protein bL33 n=1 Tax=Mesobacillus foraminis TaxID=279826 RepID=A0A4R2AZM1_9BACI|nr:50S ribosomal protein L33 [Mesobacillus foraminis]MBT2758965.1 50S ribosomal protein L33 [Mesobacillus foraminis]TCN19376.1 large subunit ribosomal protein L33 [Mesobacillus foraminis]